VDRDTVTAAFDALDAAVDGVLALDFEALTTRERLALLERCERVRRRLPAAEYPLINQLAHQATPEELGGKLSHAVAEWTLISRAEASRRIRGAADLGPRRTITGEPLAPVLAATAAAQRKGRPGAGHVAVIRRFYHQAPGRVDAATRDQAEADLARLGSQMPAYCPTVGGQSISGDGRDGHHRTYPRVLPSPYIATLEPRQVD
jgi:Domain of unknown function (DUF222)